MPESPNEPREILWDWFRPQTLEDELAVEATFTKVFDLLREIVVLHPEPGLEGLHVYGSEDAARILTAMFEITRQLVWSVAEMTGIPPVELVNIYEKARPRYGATDES